MSLSSTRSLMRSLATRSLSMNANLLRPVTAFRISRRYKTYLVGVDGSGYGFAALKSVMNGASNGDEVICMYFPPNLELMMVTPSTVQSISKELYDAQHEHTKQIEQKCKEIVKENSRKDINVEFEMHVGEHSFSPKDDLVEECYRTKADVLVVGAKGLTHSMKDKIADKLTGAGSVTSHVLHAAPCDVMVVKIPHEY